MPLVPQTKPQALAWFESHETTWFNNASQIGLTSAQATAYQSAVNDLRTKYDQANLAREEAKGKTLLADNAFADVRELTADMVALIRTYARQTDNPDVYGLANIPAPGGRTPAPPPTPPTNVSANLLNNGNINLSWRATRLNGTFFTVWRRDSDNQDFAMIGMTGGKKFLDDAVPTGVAWVEYHVISLRGEESSDTSEPAIVVFGTALSSAA